MSGRTLLLVNLAAAWFLTGLSWFLQLVQLPLLANADPALWAAHRRRNTLLMAPPMMVELVAAAWLGLATPPEFSHRDMFHLFLLVIAIWLITFLRHVPLHQRWIDSGNRDILRSIRSWNWVRTLAWTARAVFLVLTARFC